MCITYIEINNRLTEKKNIIKRLKLKLFFEKLRT